MNNKDLKPNSNDENKTADESDSLNATDYEEIAIDLEGKKKTHKRNDFSSKTKRFLASRVGFKCSNPECRRCTIGPGKDSNKIVLLGEAAHIIGAVQNDDKTKSPRADASKSSKYIKSLENGIWLCAYCHKLVDSDSKKYTVEILKEWKRQAEAKQAEELAKIKSDFIEKYISPNIKSNKKGIDPSMFKPKEWCLLAYMISIYLEHDHYKSRYGLYFDDLDNNFIKSYKNWLSDNNIDIKTSGLNFYNTEYFLEDLGEICNKLVGLVKNSDDGLNYGDGFEKFVETLLKDDNDALSKIIKDLSIF